MELYLGPYTKKKNYESLALNENVAMCYSVQNNFDSENIFGKNVGLRMQRN